MSLIEASAKALIKPKPKQGTPLVEKHLHPSTSPAHVLVPLSNGSPPLALTLAIPLTLVVLLRGSLRSRHFGSDSPSLTSMTGCCLARHLTAREDMKVEAWVLQIFHNGYRIPFSLLPLVVGTWPPTQQILREAEL